MRHHHRFALLGGFALTLALGGSSCVAPGTSNEDGGADALQPCGPDAADGAFSDADTADTTAPYCPWSPFEAGLRGGAISDLAFDPRTPGVVFATTGRSLLRSADGGDSWTHMGDASVDLRQLAFPPALPNTLLAATSSGVWISPDSGVTWASKSLSGTNTLAILAHPAKPGRIFVSLRAAGIFRSDDGGESWKAVNAGIPFATVNALNGDPNAPDRILAGVTYLGDGGANLSDGGLLVSDNSGDQWETAWEGKGWGLGFSRCPSNPDVLVAPLRTGGLATSNDGGDTWTITPLSTFDDGHLRSAAVGGAGCASILVAAESRGVYRSTDGGANFIGPIIDGFELQPSKPNPDRVIWGDEAAVTALAATRAGLYRSLDAGMTWSSGEEGNSLQLRRMRVSPVNPDALWAGTSNQGLWRKPAFDADWERVPIAVLPRDKIAALALDPWNKERIFVGTSPDLWRSTDGGASFEALTLSANPIGMAFDPDDSDVVYAVTQIKGVFKSTDGGDSWATSNGDLTPWPTAVGTFIDTRSLLINPADPQNILLGTLLNGLWETTDGGESWLAIAPILAGKSVMALLRDVDDPDRLYAQTHHNGLYHSVDGGASWTAFSNGLNALEVRSLIQDSATGTLYVSLLQGAIFSSTGGDWTAFSSFCLPDKGFQALEIIEDIAGSRWLVAAGAGSNVVVHSLPETL